MSHNHYLIQVNTLNAELATLHTALAEKEQRLAEAEGLLQRIRNNFSRDYAYSQLWYDLHDEVNTFLTPSPDPLRYFRDREPAAHSDNPSDNPNFCIACAGAPTIHTCTPLDPDEGRIYPCKECGIMRTRAEGGTTFTVCDKCWDKKHHQDPSHPTGPDTWCGEAATPVERPGDKVLVQREDLELAVHYAGEAFEMKEVAYNRLKAVLDGKENP